MKVLMVNTPMSARFRGGDTVQMHETAEALKPLGVTVSLSCELEPDARGFDLVHVFNLRTVPTTLTQVESVRRYGIPVVLSPIYLEPSFALWGTKMVENIFRRRRTEADVDILVQRLKNRSLRVKYGNRVLSADTRNRPRPQYDEMQRAVLRHVSYLLPNSYLEMDQLAKTLRVCDIPFDVVPYAAAAGVFLDPDPGPFVGRFGVKDFVLQVGRIELSKNQLLLSYALRDTGLPLVCIGGNTQEWYLEACKRWGQHLTIIPHLSQRKLAAAYASARVHALPSWIETCGLTTMEAALANCNVVASIAGYEREYYRRYPYYCDPSDVDSIRNAVTRSYRAYQEDQPRRDQLKALILREYTWQRAATVAFAAYQRVLASRSAAAH